MSLVKSSMPMLYCSAWQNQCKKIYIHSTGLVKKKKKAKEGPFVSLFHISAFYCFILPSEPKPWIDF